MNAVATVATVGSFDGVHTGHQAVLDTLLSVAHEKGLRPLAITFDRHPLEIIAPERAPGLLSSHERQEYFLHNSGVELLRTPFTTQTSLMSAREWLRELRDRHGVTTLVVGYDNTFGHDGIDMNISDYVNLGLEEGITVLEAPLVAGVSSSGIRRLISEGKIEEANKMLGYPYELEGVVIAGEALGRTIGYPTANLGVHPRRLIPGNGVYATEAVMPDGSVYPAMVNIGTRPTVDESGRRSVEAHIIGWDGDLYCRQVRLRFLRRLRDEQKFETLDNLREQLNKDSEKTLEIFHTLKKN